MMDNAARSRARFTRRTLVKSACGLGAGAVLTGLPAGVLARQGWRQPPRLPAHVHGADVATAWFRLALLLVQSTPGFSPPVASRAFGYLGVALYEALAPGMPGYRSLAALLSGLQAPPGPRDHAYHWPTVANSTLASSLRLLFPTAPEANQAAIDAMETAFLATVSGRIPSGLLQRSIGRGRNVAQHIFEWSRDDGGHEGYLTNFPADYVPPTGEGGWVPTPPGFLPALQPYWGNNRPFVLASGAGFDPGPPSPFSIEQGSAFYNEAREVYETVENLTDEQRVIALFWADDPGSTATPPGHSLSILTQILEERDVDLATAAESYARVGMAVADAFVCCWQTKYRYNLLRPITYIQQHIDAGWGVGERALPLATPPFPEYTSGHSVQTAAFAQILVDLFGDFSFTDHTHAARGIKPRSFRSCLEMAEEAAISRLYGGIHFRSAIERGVEQGKWIGQQVSALDLRAS